MNHIRMFGYGNAMELQELTDENVADIEIKVRTRMLSVLKAESEVDISKELRINWFGRFYWNAPHEFEFLSGEKKLLRRLVEYAKSVNERNNNPKEEFENKTELKTFMETLPQSQILLRTLLDSSVNNLDRKKGGCR